MKYLGTTSPLKRSSWARPKKSSLKARSNRRVFVLAFAALCLGASALASVGPSAVSVDMDYAQGVADYQNVSVSEALELIEAQELQVERANEVTAEGYGEDGVFLDGSRLVVNATDENFGSVSSFVSTYDDSSVEVRRVENGLNSLNEIGSEVDRISSRYPGVIETWSADPVTDTLNVSVKSSSPSLTEVSEELDDLGVVDLVEADSDPAPIATYRAIGFGFRTPSGGTCTIGPTYRHSTSGNLFTVTAAHCITIGETVYFSGLDNVVLGLAYSTAVDQGHDVPLDLGVIRQGENDVVNGYLSHETEKLLTEDEDPYVGQHVCHLGGVSDPSSSGYGGVTCGSVTHVDSGAGTFQSDICLSEGDSGGAVVSGNGSTLAGISVAVLRVFGLACWRSVHVSSGSIVDVWDNLELVTH